jgi:hypothetical protein
MVNYRRALPGIDAAPGQSYMLLMRGALRTILVVLTLAFLAGTVLNATRAATMGFAMAAASTAGMGMAGCDDCGDDGDGPMGSAMAACAALCATPPMAPPAFAPEVAAFAPDAAVPVPTTPAPVGLTGPPDLHPPRSTVLS